MKEKILKIAVIASVALVALVALVELQGPTGAQTTNGRLLVSGYIDDNEDENRPMCRSSMTAIAQPGNKQIGHGRVTGNKYFIELMQGWEKSSSIDFHVYDVSQVFCSSLPISNFTNATNGEITIDLECNFQSYNCFYYTEYDHIEGEAEKYWSKVPYIGGGRVYR